MDQSCPDQELGYPEWDDLADGAHRLDALGIVQKLEVLLYGFFLSWKLVKSAFSSGGIVLEIKFSPPVSSWTLCTS